MATKSGIEHNDYLQQLFRLGIPSIACFISSIIKSEQKCITKNVYVRSFSDRVLINLGHSTNFT